MTKVIFFQRRKGYRKFCRRNSNIRNPLLNIVIILQQFDSGSNEYTKVYQKLERFYWLNSKAYIVSGCRRCGECFFSKRPTISDSMAKVHGSPYKKITIDMIEPFSENQLGNRYLQEIFASKLMSTKIGNAKQCSDQINVMSGRYICFIVFNIKLQIR